MDVGDTQGEVIPAVHPGVAADPGRPGEGGDGLLGGHHVVGGRAAGGGLLAVRPVDVVNPGVVLLGAAEGAGAAQRLDGREDVPAGGVSPLSALTAAVRGNQPL